jgi:hypothetical protein
MPITATSRTGTASCAANLSNRLRPAAIFCPGSPMRSRATAVPGLHEFSAAGFDVPEEDCSGSQHELPTLEVHDLPQDRRYLWSRIRNRVKPNPLTLSAHNFRVRPIP